MTHRAAQIIDAVTQAVSVHVPSGVRAYSHRRLTLSGDYDELPAITVDFGEDQPVDGPGSSELEGLIVSLLTVNVTAIVADPDEHQLRRRLLELRADVHRALMSNLDLGLAFVLDTHYGGASPPEFDVAGDQLVGELTSQWGVRYEMQLDNPE